MGKVWVLGSETKGTGANMVPLERVLRKPSAHTETVFVPRKPHPRPPEAPKPRARSGLSDEGSARDAARARETIDALAGFRSIVDFTSRAAARAERWRILTLDESRQCGRSGTASRPTDRPRASARPRLKRRPFTDRGSAGSRVGKAW